MKNPRALRHSVTIQHLVAGSPSQKPNGEPNEVWVDYLTPVSAEWVTLRGAALFAAQEQRSEVRGIWRIRWREGITSKMRIVQNGLYYDIAFVPPFDRNGKKLEMDLEVTEGMTNG